MIGTIVVTILLVLLVGAVVQWYLNNEMAVQEITMRELLVTSVGICFVVVPAVVILGWKLAINNRTSFQEFRNGWEVEAVWNKIKCSRDGPCLNEYSCDPYTICRPCSCGKNCTTTCCTVHWHQCPYCTEEWNFLINSTIGPFVVQKGRLPTDPDKHRWRSGVAVSRSVQSSAGVGIHPFWAAADARIKAGKPGPVTGLFSYENYILVSERTILGQYAEAVNQYKGLLPKIQDQTYNYYHADKVYTIGAQPPNLDAWKQRVEYINAELGRVKQGDLHVVLVNHPKVTNPDDYMLTLKAFWQNVDSLDLHALPKNSFVVVIGFSGGVVEWARAFNGMPEGNELPAQLVRNLKGQIMSPDSVLGTVVSRFAGPRQPAATITGGVGGIVFTSFERAKMERYAYLKGEIEPTTNGKLVLVLVAVVLSSLIWIIPVMLGERPRSYYTHRRW